MTNYAVGIDVGGTNLRAAQISPSGEILKKAVVAGSREPSAALGIIRGLAAQMDGAHAAAIGIGVPGRVDGLRGEVLSGGFLNLAGIDLRAELGGAFGCPVVVENDCSMALIAEAQIGAARGLQNVVMLTIGTGIGGAIIDNGRIVRGKRCAGQLGHLVVKAGGRQCLCGQRGCVETESSGTALRRHLDEAGYGPQTRFEDVHSLATSGNAAAVELLQAWAGPLKAAIVSLSAALDPDVVILGGGMGQAACRALDFLPADKSWYDVEIRHAALGDDAGVIGAGLAAFTQLHAAGKRLVMVNGVPASGKSSVARALAERTGWPILGLDTIKNPHLELIANVDRDFNRLLGRASYKAIFSIIKESAAGSTFIVDAWFGFQPIETLKAHIEMAGITRIAEIWCHAPPEVVGERYGRRAGNRLPGHPGPSYVPELIGLAARAKPAGLGDVLDVDTSQPRDIDRVEAWIRHQFAS